MNKPPRVSVGLIVYNGENYLAEAIKSLLAQTFDDFELIISDNGSNDATEAICREFASLDIRIRYYREDINRGATWNHNRVIDLARGEFFKLAAHDDLCEPLFLEACVKALDENLEAVLSFTDAKLLRGDFKSSMQIHRHTMRTDSPSCAIRFADMIEANLQGYQVFGCIRMKTLHKMKLFGPWKGADRLFVADLALQGPFVQIKDLLFIYRLHPEQSISMVDKPADYVAWWSSGDLPNKVYPQWRFLRELLAMVWRADLPRRAKKSCYAMVYSWASKRRNQLLQEWPGLKTRTASQIQS